MSSLTLTADLVIVDRDEGEDISGERPAHLRQLADRRKGPARIAQLIAPFAAEIGAEAQAGGAARALRPAMRDDLLRLRGCLDPRGAAGRSRTGRRDTDRTKIEHQSHGRSRIRAAEHDRRKEFGRLRPGDQQGLCGNGWMRVGDGVSLHHTAFRVIRPAARRTAPYSTK